MHLCRLPNGNHSYAGWYHIVGKLVAGGECWQNVAMDGRVADLDPITDYFSLGFSSDRSLAEPAFTSLPIVQIEFCVEAPWMISEPEWS